MDAQPQSAVWNGLFHVTSDSWTRDGADIDLLIETTTELMSASSTFNQMVNALKASPRLMLTLADPPIRHLPLGCGRAML